MASTDKLTALAFAPSATEGEAINAFLALRRAGYSPSVPTSGSTGFGNKSTMEWSLKIPCKSFDAFFHAVVSYRDVPYYTFKVTEYRGKLLDRWQITLKVFFDTNAEREVFEKYFNDIFSKL